MARRKDDFDLPERDGLIARASGAALDNPLAAGGAVVMALTGCLIIANAVSLQPQRHPAPLMVSRERTADLPTTDARTVEAQPVSTLILDIQTELRRLGLYEGLLDGLVGPATERSIRRYEILTGLPETGQPTSALLAKLLMETGNMAAASQAIDQAALAGDPSAALGAHVPVPRPSPFAHPARNAPSQTVLPAAPTFTPAPQAVAEAAPVPPRNLDDVTGSLDMDGRRLARIQALLSELGYGPLRADGVMSKNTANAIQRFELDRGMAITGQVSPALIQALEDFTGIPFEG
ncbi:peptidoglycan-binding protein [Microvirga tunisiensis]|uniref:Peptidoglycan-binding protein n=2 Tax=Pannonibacter tanglangensis TaxID=2750084 RepID=A0ABW9ZG07_9HYPH|nr:MULTISPECIES: peptidoglycan-binding protein [unclassified Pannonibacter]NBN62917.1 peptidoglycan-binding protein [Pannonibacter sp. XCT-34]NBN78491.1 peptidoglycan-binding protein [Pannonibacter sp. XCT-53]